MTQQEVRDCRDRRTTFAFRAVAEEEKNKTRIPDELWSAAVGLARRHGINRTAALYDWMAGN